MKTTIDSGGRVVIPKALRERAGLVSGMEVDLRFNGESIEIAPSAPAGGRIVYRNGLPYWESAPGTPPLTAEDVNNAIRSVREEREERIVGEALGLEDRS